MTAIALTTQQIRHLKLLRADQPKGYTTSEKQPSFVALEARGLAVSAGHHAGECNWRITAAGLAWLKGNGD